MGSTLAQQCSLVEIHEKNLKLSQNPNPISPPCYCNDPDEGCTEIINTAKEFATTNNLSQCDFKVVRARKKKIMSGELSTDEVLCSPTDLFRCDVCFKVLDAIIHQLTLGLMIRKKFLKI